MNPFEMLLMMVAAHGLCDYPLQGDWLSKAKNPTLALVPNEAIWPGALFFHAMIHAAAVKLITGSWTFAIAEFVIHAATDYAKCKGAFGYNTDQIIHVVTKVMFFAVIVFVGSMP